MVNNSKVGNPTSGQIDQPFVEAQERKEECCDFTELVMEKLARRQLERNLSALTKDYEG